MSIASELERVRKGHRGVLRPVDVVEFARNPKTELHGRFEWDDTKAAHEYRLEQARHVIRFAVECVRDEMDATRTYVSLKGDRGGNSYRRTVEVLSDAELRAQLLDEAFREMEGWKLRYQRFEELVPIVQAINRAQKQRVRKRATKKGKGKRRGAA